MKGRKNVLKALVIGKSRLAQNIEIKNIKTNGVDDNGEQKIIAVVKWQWLWFGFSGIYKIFNR